jgi:hypothetical protein
MQMFAEMVGCDLSLAKSMMHAHRSGVSAAKIAIALRAGKLPVWEPH